MQTKKIVITGGPSTGKTAVIENLEDQGFTCLHEVIRSMTLQKKEEQQTRNFKSNPIVSVDDPMAFNNAILKARIAQYKTIESIEKDVVFLDRGIPDVLAYMDCFKQTYDEHFIEACTKHSYDFVFFMPPWQEIYVSDNERLESYEESLLINECLLNTYQQLGYNTIIVPKDSIANRIDFILNTIQAG